MADVDSTEQKEIEEKACSVLLELLDSDDEKIRIKAAKLYSVKNGREAVTETDGNLFKVRTELLDSDDEKIRLKAVEHILIEGMGRKKGSGSKIISPYENWYKENFAKNRYSKKNFLKNAFRNKKFKYYWFGKTGYSPHDSQKLVHACNKRFIVCISGRRFGKSILAAKEAEVTLMQPGKRVWVVAPTYALTDKVFREIYNNLVIKNMAGEDAIIKKSENERLIRLAWGSEVVGKSSDNPDSLLGEAVDLLIFDECAKARERIWEKYLRPTLTDRKGRALFITTPEGTNWTYQLYQRGKGNMKHKNSEDKIREWASFLFPTEKNPHLAAEDILEAKSTLSAEVFNQEYMADFFTFSGKVYKEFLFHTHTF
jgi:hypothetical protein